MKTETLTAYVLNELPPDERAALEAQMKNDPALRKEAEEMKQFCSLLEREVGQDAGDSLMPAERAQLMQKFQGARPAIRPFWRRPAFLSSAGFAAAACLAVMLTIQHARHPQDLALMQPPQATESRSNVRLAESKDGDQESAAQSVAAEPAAAGKKEAAKARFVDVNEPLVVRYAPPMPAVQSEKSQSPAPNLSMNEAVPGSGVTSLSKEGAGTITPGTAKKFYRSAVFGDDGTIQVQQVPQEARSLDVAGIAVTSTAGSGGESKAAQAAGGDKSMAPSDPAGPAIAIAGIPSSPAAAAPAAPAVSSPPASIQAKVGAGTLTISGVVTGSGTTLSRNAGDNGAFGAGAAATPVPAAKPVMVPLPTVQFGFTTTTESDEPKLKQIDDIAVLSAGAYPLPRDEKRFTKTRESNTATYRPIIENPFTFVAQQPLSTFSLDVDTASYANVRRLLNSGQHPPPDAVRLEELINYFPYHYEGPTADKPIGVQVDLAEAPWQPLHRIARVAVKAREIKGERPAANFVFLLDVSGSMQPTERLPLIKQSLRLLVDQLREDDRVAIVTYAGESGLALESTPGAQKEKIQQSIQALKAGGSTNGASGIRLAYEQAALNFKKDRVNRVILCTDGDFNVGTSSVSELEKLIAEKAKGGVFLSVLGVGTDNLHDHTMQTLADRGNGNYHYLDSVGEARKVLVEQMTGTLVTVAKDVKLQVEFNPAQVAAYRLIGYEKRMLAKEDFNNDKKDAGEIGAGHTVTALYEIVPASLKYPDGKPLVDELKYALSPVQRPDAPAAEGSAAAAPSPKPQAPSPETLTVKVRYKEPGEDQSKLFEVGATDAHKKLAGSDRDFQFAVSVAGFGMLLRGSPNAADLTWDGVRQLALAGKGEDEQGWRGEFIQLIEKARGVCEERR